MEVGAPSSQASGHRAQVTLPLEELGTALDRVRFAIAPPASVPILTHMLLDARDGVVCLSATDLEVAIRVRVLRGVAVEQPFAVCLPARELRKVVHALLSRPPARRGAHRGKAVSRPGEMDVVLAVDGEGSTKLTLTCGRSRYQLWGLPADDFPPLLRGERTDIGWVRGADLQRLITHTRFAVSTEKNRPILNGALWSVRPNYMCMVATNGHRLAKMELPTAEVPCTPELIAAAPACGLASSLTRDLDVILPSKALDGVCKVLPADAGLEVRHGEDGWVEFRSQDVTVLARRIEGEYPDYDKVLPRHNDRIAMVSRASLLKCLAHVGTVVPDGTRRVRLSFSTERLRLSSASPSLGNAQDELPIRYTGEPFDVGFNVGYLIEVLGHIPTEEVRLTLSSPERASTVEPVGWDDPAQYLCVVMPLRLVD